MTLLSNKRGRMQETLFAILTDEKARTACAVETKLDQTFTVGVPWFDRGHLDLLHYLIDD